jgi:hypothetical protein
MLRIRIQDPDPGYGMKKSRSGINIPRIPNTVAKKFHKASTFQKVHEIFLCETTVILARKLSNFSSTIKGFVKTNRGRIPENIKTYLKSQPSASGEVFIRPGLN